jgi:hypothetical protein
MRRRALRGAIASRKKGLSEDEVPPPPQTLEDAVHWASWVTWAVAVGKVSARTAREIGYNLRGLMDGLEKREIAEEIERLRGQVVELKRRGSLKAG